MARPREFDVEEAVEGAMQIFWRNGYGATNLPDLLEAMGLSRGSFYKAFGDKRNAYLQALQRYDDTHISGAIALLEGPGEPSGRARILKLFDKALTSQAGELRGCLVCNAMVELGPSDSEVAQMAASICKRMQDAFELALREDQGGEVGASDMTAWRAAAITNVYFGAQAIRKTGQAMPAWPTVLADLIGPA
ncbi:MAG: TetR/AcrR family transcriptional regulator [Pseudomonadota bacterium]